MLLEWAYWNDLKQLHVSHSTLWQYETLNIDDVYIRHFHYILPQLVALDGKNSKYN